MPRISHVINSFNGGEVSPEFDGRTDQDKYRTSARTIDNFIVHPEGGVHRRPGTRYVEDNTDSTKRSRLIPFVFSTVQAYMLEFSEGKIRVFADDVRVNAATQDTVEEASAQTDEFELEDHGYVNGQGPIHITATGGIPTGLAVDTDYWIVTQTTTVFEDADVSVAADTITTATDHNYKTEQGPFRLTTIGALPEPFSANTDYYIEATSSTTFKLRATPGGAAINILSLRGGTHTLAPTGDYRRDKFRLAATEGGTPINLTTDGTSPHTFTPNPAGDPVGLPLEIPTPYLESELPNLHIVQSADFLFIDHPDHRPAQLTRKGTTKWAYDAQNIIDGPYLAENTVTADTITPSAQTGFDITLTLQSGTEINDGAGWTIADIGRNVRLKDITSWGSAEITGIHETGTGVNLVARATVRQDFDGVGASSKWRLGSWYSGNWPSTLSFSDQRLWHAGEANTPQTLHGSMTGRFFEFSPTDASGTVLDTSAVNFEIGSNQVNAAKWLGVERQLFMGSGSAIFTARASTNNEAVTPTNITMPKITSVGSSSVQPINVGQELLYITRNSQSLRAIKFTSESDTFTPVDLNVLAKHIFGRTETVSEISFQLDRQQVIWVVRSDGVLVACTYNTDQNIFAWHRHSLGGNFGGSNAFVESVATIPAPDGTHDQVWMIVKRTVNGATVRHIEFFEDEWFGDDITSMRYVDSAPVAYSGAATSSVSGLDHLEGETVQVLADGAAHPDRVVASGAITLDAEYTDILVGLGYVSEIETLKLEPPDPEGGAMGKVARIDHIVLRLFQSLGGDIGPDEDHLDPLVYRDASDPMDTPPPTFTGDKKISFEGGFQREKVILVRQSQPLPLNILAMNVMMSTGAR